MSYDSTKLKTRIIERFGNQKKFAEALGIEESTVSRYLDGREWKGSTMVRAIKILEIPFDEVDSYFFEPKVVNLQPIGKEV